MSGSTWWWHAIYHFSLEELTLEIGGNVVNAADSAAFTCGVSEEPARRMMGQGFGEGLIIINSCLQSAALHAETRFRSAVTLELEYPNKFVDASAGWNL